MILEPKRRFVTRLKLFWKVCNLGVLCVSEMTRTSGGLIIPCAAKGRVTSLHLTFQDVYIYTEGEGLERKDSEEAIGERR